MIDGPNRGIRVRLSHPDDTMPAFVDRRAPRDGLVRLNAMQDALRAAIALGPCPGSPADRLSRKGDGMRQ